MAIVQMQNLFKHYYIGKLEVPALTDVSVVIEEGDFLSIAGPSGSGKTTMLNLLGCLDKPSHGKVLMGTDDVSEFNSDKLADIRNFNIGFIFQTFNLIPVLSAEENVEFPLLLYKKFSKKERKEKVLKILENLGILELAKRKPNEMSGGQQQRVAIARALVKDPKIVLADEPTANLDSKTGENILQLMKEINQKTKTTFVFSTHDPMVMSFANRLLKIHDGMIQSDERV